MRKTFAALLLAANIAFFLSFSVSAPQEEPITASNWQQHPKIRQVRAIVDSVNAGIRKGSFKMSKKEFEYCESYEDTLRMMAVDSKGPEYTFPEVWPEEKNDRARPIQKFEPDKAFAAISPCPMKQSR